MAPELSELAKSHLGNPKVVGTYRRVSQHVDVAPVHSDQAFPQLPSFFTQSDVLIGGRVLNAFARDSPAQPFS
jgi:hypothetical protein